MVLEIVVQHFLQRQGTRTSTDDGKHVDTERRLHRCLFVEIVQDDTRIRITADLHYDTHTAAIGLITQIGDAFDFFLTDEIGNFFNETGFVDLVWQLRHDDPFAIFFRLFDFSFCPDDD